MHFHTIFFDAGGTLVGGESTLWVLARRLDEKRQKEIFKFLLDLFMEVYLDDNPRVFISIKDLLKLSVQKAARILGTPDISEEVYGYYRQNHMENDFLFDETRPTLERLKKDGTKIVLISDADADVLIEQMKAYDLLSFFEGTIISSNVEAYKPSDKTVSEALKFCREPLSEILFVGDNFVDMKTAQKMGVKRALINRNGNFKHDADFQIKSLTEIFDLKPEGVS